jgi:hypothetical protein
VIISLQREKDLEADANKIREDILTEDGDGLGRIIEHSLLFNSHQRDIANNREQTVTVTSEQTLENWMRPTAK